jgi:hypothetical protein
MNQSPEPKIDRLRRSRSTLRANAPLLVLGVLLTGSLLTHCSGHTDQAAATTPDASAGASGSIAVSVCHPATTARDCPLPASICSDPQTISYYTDAACVAGKCQWMRATMACPGYCSGGSCAFSTTTVAGPPAEDSGIQGTDSGIDAGAPLATCDEDAGGAGAAGESGGSRTCELPPSLCADARTLLYFANPACVKGVCKTEVHSQACATECVNGGCLAPSVTK